MCSEVSAYDKVISHDYTISYLFFSNCFYIFFCWIKIYALIYICSKASNILQYFIPPDVN